MDIEAEGELRRAAMAWLDQQTRGSQSQGLRQFHRAELQYGFSLGRERIPLVGAQQGIWKPRALTAALSILTTYRAPGLRRPYEDAPGPDGYLRYKYRGQDPGHADNRALRAALEFRLPLIWFWGVETGVYEAVRPVWLIAEEPEDHQFVVAVDAAQRSLDLGRLKGTTDRQYVEYLTRQRVHQPIFRAQVIRAYQERCAMCRLRYVALLDAAHILRDGHPRGDPVVENGLSLCKIHHAAFDQNLIGVDPDTLAVEVRPDVRQQSDGPMLLHGLQEMHGVRLVLPSAPRARPDRSRLAERWEEFRRTG